MAKQLRPRRGSTDANASLTGALGEVTVDTTKSTLRVHDGSTAGGTELARTKDIPTKTSQLTNDSGFPVGTIPSKVSQLSNDSGYITSSSIPTKLSQLSNDVGYTTGNNVLGSENASIEFKPTSSQSHGGFIDFHFKGDTSDYTSRIIEEASGKISIVAKNGVLVNGTAVLTSHQSLANCYKITGGALNSGAQISRATYGTSWINGRNAALVRQTSAPGSSWGPIGSCKVTSGSWDFGCLSDNFYFSYATDTNFNAGTNGTTLQFIITPTGVSVAGTCSVGGALTGSTVKATSDRNLKTDFSEVKYDLSSLKAYRYKFKEGEDKEYHVGLIAQEVQEIIPEAVSKADDHLVLDYNSVVAALVAKVNDLQKQIDELKESK